MLKLNVRNREERQLKPQEKTGVARKNRVRGVEQPKKVLDSIAGQDSRVRGHLSPLELKTKFTTHVDVEYCSPRGFFPLIYPVAIGIIPSVKLPCILQRMLREKSTSPH